MCTCMLSVIQKKVDIDFLIVAIIVAVQGSIAPSTRARTAIVAARATTAASRPTNSATLTTTAETSRTSRVSTAAARTESFSVPTTDASPIGHPSLFPLLTHLCTRFSFKSGHFC